MSFKLFKKYLELCRETDKEPNWNDLKVFHELFT
ncbi:hypothetical protein HMPREF9476_02290 [Clostridium perfringens WAL-14572]|nr:hypothetical protein HMPREF9476_02290 [Clostridium perfringens WAL-14572]